MGHDVNLRRRLGVGAALDQESEIAGNTDHRGSSAGACQGAGDGVLAGARHSGMPWTVPT